MVHWLVDLVEAASSARITCIVGDDHPPVIAAVTAYLEQEGIPVVASARTGDELLMLLREHRPDVGLIDLMMPGLPASEVLRTAARSGIPTGLVAYTGYSSHAMAQEALDAGARGVILKDAPLQDLVRALRVVAHGGRYVDPIFATEAEDSARLNLTERERDVLRLLADGLSNQEIGSRLFISAETVRSHIQKSMSKLEAKTRVEAVAKALRLSLIS